MTETAKTGKTMRNEVSSLESEFVAGAVSALRRRAARQAAQARAGTARVENGALVRTGDAAVASRLAEALGAIADEIEREGRASWPTSG